MYAVPLTTERPTLAIRRNGAYRISRTTAAALESIHGSLGRILPRYAAIIRTAEMPKRNGTTRNAHETAIGAILSADLPPAVRRLAGAYGRQRTDPPILFSTEIILNAGKPYVISVNAHSARHWELVFPLSTIAPHTMTRWDRVMSAIDRRPPFARIVLHEGASEHERQSRIALAAAIDQGRDIAVADDADFTALRQSMSNGRRSLLLEIPPPIPSNDGLMDLIGRRALATIFTPIPALSSLNLLALIRGYDMETHGAAAADRMPKRLAGCERDIDALRPHIAETALLHRGTPPGMIRRRCEDGAFVLRTASPLSAQKRRLSVERQEDRAASLALRNPFSAVLQERIKPDRCAVPIDHAIVSCPIRLITYGCGTELLACVAIAQRPPNDEFGARNIALAVSVV